MHTSVRLETPCEFINITPINPLISKCQIKVCYVSDEPNRNRSIITKDVAREMANSLPGSPIVGFYNEAKEDFEEHNRSIDISNGQFIIKDTTRPYGFVDLGAKCWFQKFLDDGENEREYLMTEGYIWTGQYPEAKRIIDKGNNQSMELDEKTLNATWSKDNNGKNKFFIINEAIISKLCILGEENEPCFEGSNITKVQFSFEDSFKEQLFSFMTEVKEILNKGGAQVFTTYAVKVGDSLWSTLYNHVYEKYSIVSVCEDEGQKYAVLQDKTDETYCTLDFSLAEDGQVTFAEETKIVEYTPAEEPQFSADEIEAFEKEFKKADEEDKKKKEEGESKDDSKDSGEKEDSSSKESAPAGDDKKDKESQEDEGKNSDSKDKDDEEDKKKKKYSLEEIPEYAELFSKYSSLKDEYKKILAERDELKKFKLSTERADKEKMINSTFYMLSEEDKKEVLDNIDKYSLNEIEEKLSVICFRKKINFADFEEDGQKDSDPYTYNLDSDIYKDDSTPAWVKAVLDTAKTLN